MEAPMVAISTRNELTLPDGRQLGYATYGHDELWPILFFHGTPGSRHTAHLAGLVASTHESRVIALERPGYGLSDAQPGRQIHDWPADVEAAADLLGIGRFSLIGYSGGGPFSLATAASLGDRVASIAVVSGMGPVHHPLTEAHLTRQQRLRRFGVARLSPIVRLLAWQVGRQVRGDVRGFVERSAAASPPADQEHMRRPEIRAVIQQDMLESYRQGGAAVAREFGLLARPWGFDLDAVQQPVQIWHGSDDDVVPLWLAEVLAEVIPHARRRFLSGVGHLLLLDHMDAILEQLLASRTATPTAGAAAG
jgi:pimeloyl-ACP methyl ester carboxylesterase